MLSTKNKISILRNAGMFGALLWLSVSPAVLPAEAPKLPDGPGKEITIKVCSACHSVDVAISKRESRAGWNALIDDMIQRGAKATDDEFGQVVDYLVDNFPKQEPGGKVNVNSATAKDLAGTLEISDKQAAAIVRYREEKGKFKSFEDLAKVHGLDLGKIESKKSRLTF